MQTNKKETIIAFVLFFFTVIVYIVSGYPTLAPYRDSGDLASGAFVLGIPHPPGYPLYICLGKLVVHLLPFGSIGLRCNLLSIIAGACSVLFVFLIIRRFAGIIAACAGAVSLACSPALWRLSQVSEMYSVNAVIAAFVIWWLVRKQKPARAIYLTALACGIGLTNHQTLMFFFPGFAVILWQYYYNHQHPKKMLTMITLAGFFFVLGLGLYAFLPVRSITNPIMDWGDPETLRSLWRMISRSDYGLLKLHPEKSVLAWSFTAIVTQCIFFGKAIISQFGYIGISAAVCGLVYAYRKKIFLSTSVLFIFSGPVFVILANLPVDHETSLPILEPNIIMPALIVSVWIGFGIQCIAELLPRISRHVCVFAGAIVIIGSGLSSYGRGTFNRDNFLAHDYGKNVFKTMSPGSILYNPDDPTTFITEYLKYTSHLRTDIRTIAFFRTLWGYKRLKKVYPDIMPAGEQDNAAEFINLFFKKNQGIIPMFADLPVKFPSGYRTVSFGILYRLLGRTETIQAQDLERSRRLMKIYGIRIPAGLYDPDAFFSRQIVSYYSAAYNNLGIEHLTFKEYKKARQAYRKTLTLDLYFREGYINLGALEFKQNNFSKAEEYFRLLLAYYPADSDALYNLGLTLKKKGNIQEAISIFESIPDHARYKASALNELGLLALANEQYDRSIALFSRAVERNPSYALPYYNLGLAYQKKGELSKAVEWYQRYSQLTDNPAERAEGMSISRYLLDLLQSSPE
ncbi:MAG: DUF2723 domain-containing protein [Elusimicrobia bacterium]|nr:DUF2723 domain-containing protein [Elusimicrobiota bacterium]MBD3412371.1 DUF2723 domain-containing protein [Elusimicrobiota bacterium]